MDYADFGRYLTQQRELRGMSRAEVATATKIPANLLAALENGQVERLPERVFVVNYIRAYAQVIGLATEEAVLRFEEIDKSLAVSSPDAVTERKKRGPRPLALAVLLLIVLGLLAALVMAGVVHLPWRH